MNKNAQAVAVDPLDESDQLSLARADLLQRKKQKEDAIRTQLAEFAREIEQLKKLHKTH